MTIKSLLLGSAASLVAVSGVQAADVIIEPEPVEYVRVCDVYGAGFYYIPGTETCLSINGYVRLQLGFSSDDDDALSGLYGFDEDHYNARTRARLNFDARSETEFGTLRAYVRLQAEKRTGRVPGTPAGDTQNGNPGADPLVILDRAFLSLGGLEMGYTNSFYDRVGSSYGEDTFNDGGGAERQLIGYTYSSDLFTLGIAVEDDNRGDTVDETDADFAPDVAGYIRGSFAGLGVFFAAGYDSDVAIDGPNDGDNSGDDGFGLKAGVNYNVDRFGVQLTGLYADSGNAYAPGAGDNDSGDTGGNAFAAGSEWSAILTTRFAATDRLALALSGQYFWNFYPEAAPFVETDVDGYQIEFTADYALTPGFNVLGAIAYRDISDDGDIDGLDDIDGSLEGFIRFTRSF